MGFCSGTQIFDDTLITFHFVGDITLQLSFEAEKNSFEAWEEEIRNSVSEGRIAEIKDIHATHIINTKHVLFVSLKWVEGLSNDN